jgi:hypothetical protein
LSFLIGTRMMCASTRVPIGNVPKGVKRSVGQFRGAGIS